MCTQKHKILACSGTLDQCPRTLLRSWLWQSFVILNLLTFSVRPTEKCSSFFLHLACKVERIYSTPPHFQAFFQNHQGCYLCYIFEKWNGGVRNLKENIVTTNLKSWPKKSCPACLRALYCEHAWCCTVRRCFRLPLSDVSQKVCQMFDTVRALVTQIYNSVLKLVYTFFLVPLLVFLVSRFRSWNTHIFIWPQKLPVTLENASTVTPEKKSALNEDS